MKIALLQNQMILIKDINYNQKESIKSMGFSWNKKNGCYEALASLFVLEELSKIVKFTGAILKLKEDMKKQQDQMNEERRSLNPKALIAPPVKVKLYDHQIRALNMALERFNIV